MKILLLNQFFWPDSSATSQLLTDLARGLAQDGHDVYAIAADGGYAVSAEDEAPDVHIHRVKAFPFLRGKLGRMLSYGSYYIATAWQGFMVPKPDVVLTLTTPPLLSLIGNALATFRGARHFIWEMDVYPDVAVALGYFKAGGLADRITGTLADWSRQRADGVVALGECMKDRLVSHGLPADRIHVVDNWADSTAISVLPRPGNPQQLVLLYSGNLGLAHDLFTITGAMRDLRADERFRFIFAGGGARRAELETIVAADDLQAVELRPYAQRSSLSEGLAAGDIGLVTQRDDCCGAVVPSKIYGLLAAGRPVLFIGPSEATPARIIRRFNCGWHIACGDVSSLTELLLFLADHPEHVASAAVRARSALLEHFDLPLGVARVAAIIGANSSAPDALRSVPATGTLREHSSARS